ncbi:hypothetical protein TTRE_0000223101 [Trichuris trichiura]|uniref:Uncharacterized protein n=1 Tax=Trichuris trichiura TaxID=36087 RepID=A0A077Z0J7_TRITR|nr:hypothetical protein TTRE_0000223101 [Trichuris trichiura]
MSLVWLFDNLRTEPFGVIPLTNLSGKGGPSTLKHIELVSSYNWSKRTDSNESAEPTIIVPGAPKQFRNWQGGKLPEDSGQFVYDVDHMIMPRCPMEALFHSAFVEASRTGKSFDLKQFDLVTDCINLQKLFTFCKGEDACGFFRIDLERIGETILATRVEGQDVINIDFPSFDQSLKQTCCAPLQLELDGAHSRIVSYQLGELRLLVRVEVDCAAFTEQELETLMDGPLLQSDSQSESIPFSTVRHIQSRPISVSSPMSSSTSPDGRGFPTFVWPLLFFSTLDSMVLGWWTDQNTFKKPVIYKLTDVNRLVKPLPYSTLSKVYDLLLKIIKFMRRNDESVKTSLVWRGQQFIEIYEKAPAASGAISEIMKNHLRGDVPAAAQDERSV